MKHGQCPLCRSREIYMRRNAANAGGLSLVISISRFFRGLTVVRLDTYVCAHCGYVALYIPNADQRRAIAKQWDQVPS
jgi:predicted nucleic-acid-binding Zn-ribbon protein